MGANNKCDICGYEELIPFKCKYCGGTFCAHHRLPETHACSGLYTLKNRTYNKGHYDTGKYHGNQYSRHTQNPLNTTKRSFNNFIRRYNRINPLLKYGLLLFISIIAIYLITVNTQVIGANDKNTLMLIEYSIIGSIILLVLLGVYSILRIIQYVLRSVFKRRVSLIMTIVGVVAIIVILYFAIPIISQITASMGQDPIIGTWTAYESITGTDMSDTFTFHSDGTFYNKKYQSPLFVSPYVHDTFGTWVKENNNYYQLTWTESGQNIMGQSYNDVMSCQLYYYPDSNTFVFPIIVSPASVGQYPPDVIFKKKWF